MPVNKFHIILTLILLCGSCVEPFEPMLEESRKVLVISGMISDQPGRHEIRVSLSSPYKELVFQGVDFCMVAVEDQEGNMVHYSNTGEGVYVADLSDSFLEVGDAVRVQVLTPEDRLYRSSYDTILACPELDSVYYELGQQETPDPEFTRPGIQFYLDMTGTPADSRNIIWQVDETWEYWASLFGTHILRGWGDSDMFLTNTIFKCWKQAPLDHVYIGSTRNLSSNELRKLPLNFVSNETDRLSVTYRLHVKQQSLSLAAYDYWKRMNDQSVESGGMYEKQPASVIGNIYNVDDPEEVVLGYFYATQLREQRLFVHNNMLFEFNVPHIHCEYQPMSSIGLLGPDHFPVYLYIPGNFQPSFWGFEECFDCRVQGGDTIRPINWESW
ncbi:MAG: DUF4249 domain-containing protein [Bacteroidetes bacterium]|nr:DUF4249 domain-containing protein [Bacteroidota bacterium]